MSLPATPHTLQISLRECRLVFERLMQVIRMADIDEMNQSVAAATEQQRTVVESISREVGEISALNQQVQSSQQQALLVCESLDGRSGELRRLVASFRTGQET
jgi:methyl-accepting chemotaxis protein